MGGEKPIQVVYDIPGDANDKHNGEGRVVAAEFSKFTLVATYVPNAGVDGLKRLDYRVKEWDVDFQAYLKKLEVTKGKPVIVCGDLNVAHQEIDIFGPKGKERRAGFTKEERDSFGKFLTQQGFVDTFRHIHGKRVKYSYWNLRSGAREKNQGWRLDYFVASQAICQQVIDSDINDEYWGSDHCPVSLTLKTGGGPVKVEGASPIKEIEKKVEEVKKEMIQAKPIVKISAPVVKPLPSVD